MQQPRKQLSEEELKQALDECAKEPIHIPGSIQAHGCLIAVDSATFQIIQVSENVKAFTGFTPEECIGQPVTKVLGEDLLKTIRPIVLKDALQPIQSAKIMLLDKICDVAAHVSGKSLIIEFEPSPENQSENVGEFYDDTRNFAVGMYKAGNLQKLYEHVVTSVRNITHFDRVKLYRFDPQWNGTVVAESKADFMTSYLGLRFPDTDIPEQARILYTKNYLRLIPDINYAPVPITPARAPFDLTLSMLRSVSPVHIQYLANMNIRASMSISVIQNGKLWGLIACHNNTPLYLPYQARMVAEIIGHIFSAQLSTLESQVKNEERGQQILFIEKLNSALKRSYQLDTLMESTHELALTAMHADGMLVSARNRILKFGDVPSASAIETLLTWLGENQNQMVFTTTDASQIKGLEEISGGFLSSSISQNHEEFIIWFRSPIIEEVDWAGNPEKPMEETKAGYRLTPRSSFKLWKESVRQHSQPWTVDNIDTARSVVNVILEGEKLYAEQANLAKSEFLANMSHEIRTPMNAVIGLATILSKSEGLTPKQKDYVQTLQLSADSLLSLINDLLDISKIEARSIELEHTPFSITQLLNEVASMMAMRAKEKGLEFTAEGECEKDHILIGDPFRVRQIILNLCSNAIKFTEKGKIHIRISLEPAEFEGIQNVCIAVSDTGIGIPRDKHEAVFHKFTQADSSITRKYGGTGLGLAITKTLTEVMNGTISLTSVPGEGSVFTVILPLMTAENESAVPRVVKQREEKREESVHRVLLVEDYAANVLVATSYLEIFGYGYDVANNGYEAIEKAKNGNYIAILMDVQMHGINGFETTKLIRQFEQKSGKPRAHIIGMTAHALTGDRERCIASDMDDYLSKPYNPDELEQKLAEVVRRRN